MGVFFWPYSVQPGQGECPDFSNLSFPKQSTSKVKAGALWPKSKDELVKQLAELKTELGQLRIQKITSSGSKLNRM